MSRGTLVNAENDTARGKASIIKYECNPYKYECNPYQHKLNLFFPPIKKLVQKKKVSFYKDLSFPNHSERNLNNLPILFSTMCLKDTSLVKLVSGTTE